MNEIYASVDNTQRMTVDCNSRDTVEQNIGDERKIEWLSECVRAVQMQKGQVSKMCDNNSRTSRLRLTQTRPVGH